MNEQISGVVERITHANPENGYHVLKVQVTGRRGLSVVVGNVPSLAVGELIEAKGEWTIHRTFGEQFKADEIRTIPPHTAKGIEKYLGSGLVKGIGPKFAKKIVDHFGERTLEVIDESPAHLREIKGIGEAKIQRIRESWQQQKSVRDIMVFLQSHGMGTARAVRIYKTYGDQAVELVRENPYRLATDIWGVGFQTADELAMQIGIDRNSMVRARAAVRYVLQQLSQQEGHVGLPEVRLVQETAQLTNVSPDIVSEAIEEERKAGDLVREPNLEEPWIYLKPLFLSELGVARSICELQRGLHPLPPDVDVDAALKWVEERMEITLADRQREALRQATQSKVLVITGGPGVGKTTIVRGLIDIFTAKKQRVALCAPTGRAAKRLTETTGRDAKTIHRLLEFDPGLGTFKKDRESRLNFDLFVVDEASMVDVVLMNQFLRAIPDHACVVLVGDVDQLPSVGPGMVLFDLIDSERIPVVRLNEIFRQAGQSWIVRAAHQINEGEVPESAPAGEGDFFFVEVDNPEVVMDRIIALLKDRIPAAFGLDPFRDVQVLTPMNKSLLGVKSLNLELQKVLNPSPEGGEVQRFGWTFRVGDKVLQTQNNYQKEVYNGDLGLVHSLDEAQRELTVSFEDRLVTYDFGELDELTLAYAISIHKSQGSEYPAVVIPVHTQHYVMLQRNLLYTGVTRGKRLVVLVGSRKALTLASQRIDNSTRCTQLSWRIQQEFDSKSDKPETLFDSGFQANSGSEGSEE